MKFTIYSAKYFEELDTYKHYHKSLEDLVKIIDEIGLSFKICKPYVSGRPYDLWLIDGYLE